MLRCICTESYYHLQLAELESDYKMDTEEVNKLKKEIADIKEKHDTITSTMGAEIKELERSVEQYTVT